MLKEELMSHQKIERHEDKQEEILAEDDGDKNIFATYGDESTGNLNPLIFNNIICCQYFKEELTNKNFEEVVLEIQNNVKNIESWAIGINGIPSTLFCCLYRLMMIKLTKEQVEFLLSYNQNPYVKIAGLLYVRYLCHPKDLWETLSKYVDIKTKFYSQIEQKKSITLGEYVEGLLTEYEHYGTRLPRIPTQIERDIKVQLHEHRDRYRRIKHNEKLLDNFDKEMNCNVKLNGEWIEGNVIKVNRDLQERIRNVLVKTKGKEVLCDLCDVELTKYSNKKSRQSSSDGSNNMIKKARSRSRERTNDKFVKVEQK